MWDGERIFEKRSCTMVRSRLSRHVLRLYKGFMRAARDKPGFKERIRAEFKQHSALPLSESMRIEYLLRRGQRQLESLQNANVKEFRVFGVPSASGNDPSLDMPSKIPQRLKKP
ncbi:hypothetical protein RvY_19284 [Ramazzottius varieornatus]|uniref:Complex 1 LYR protein domain-containing protein n=1 Tax=Ramazzottius varieornatus TaxID=947166 RepID=A0A1D1W9Z8_RAMVA|nr:hypothetical protein RvY_19284 [Ramazzottius varieornatus]